MNKFNTSVTWPSNNRWINTNCFFVFSEQTSRNGGNQTRTQLRSSGGCGCGRGGCGTLPLSRHGGRPSSSPAGRVQFSAPSGSGAGTQLPTPVERTHQQQADGVLESDLYIDWSLKQPSLLDFVHNYIVYILYIIILSYIIIIYNTVDKVRFFVISQLIKIHNNTNKINIL